MHTHTHTHTGTAQARPPWLGIIGQAPPTFACRDAQGGFSCHRSGFSPAFLAPSTVAKLSPKYLSRPLLCRVTTVAPLTLLVILAKSAVEGRGCCKMGRKWLLGSRSLVQPPVANGPPDPQSPPFCRLTYSGEEMGVRREIENHRSCVPKFSQFISGNPNRVSALSPASCVSLCLG